MKDEINNELPKQINKEVQEDKSPIKSISFRTKKRAIVFVNTITYILIMEGYFPELVHCSCLSVPTLSNEISVPTLSNEITCKHINI